ncbi:MAG: hypothetical protein V1815_01785 [Candidatus Woesearchaeota archaeon]
MRHYIKQFVKVVITGIIFAILAQIIHSGGAYFTTDYYTNDEYVGIWSQLMMPEDGAPGTKFFITSLLFNLIAGVFYTTFYIVTRASIPGRNFFRKGLFYGLFLFLVASIPGFLSLYLLINLPTMLLYVWALENFIINIFGGVIISEINR